MSSSCSSNPWEALAGLGGVRLTISASAGTQGKALRSGSVFAAMISTGPKDAQLAITELTAARFTHRHNVLGCGEEWESLFRPSI